MTIETASFKILSPKMTEYNFGSTLYVLKMARIVTGSVAESVDPKMRHSSKVNFSPSRPRNDQMYTRTLMISLGSNRMLGLAHPIPTAEMKVPRNANVRMTPKFLKKFSYAVSLARSLLADLSHAHLFQLISRVEDDWR